MLDLNTLQSLRLQRRSRGQDVLGTLLSPGYRRIQFGFEGIENLPEPPFILAMNHSDRYNNFPFMDWFRRERGLYFASWVKGKYYDNPLMRWFMMAMQQLPTVSKGYVITTDFRSVMGRKSTDAQYRVLKDWVDAQAAVDVGEVIPAPEVDEPLRKVLDRPRNMLGRGFDPAAETYAQAVLRTFDAMMAQFVRLNEQAMEQGNPLLIFPQGTRSKRLIPARPGVAQIALHLKVPVVPVGCNGSDLVFPNNNPLGRGGPILYRIGTPISPEQLAAWHPGPFVPFSNRASQSFGAQFLEISQHINGRVNELLDEPYQLAGG